MIRLLVDNPLLLLLFLVAGIRYEPAIAYSLAYPFGERSTPWRPS